MCMLFEACANVVRGNFKLNILEVLAFSSAIMGKIIAAAFVAKWLLVSSLLSGGAIVPCPPPSLLGAHEIRRLLPPPMHFTTFIQTASTPIESHNSEVTD